jgi:hypothetical protein
VTRFWRFLITTVIGMLEIRIFHNICGFISIEISSLILLFSLIVIIGLIRARLRIKIIIRGILFLMLILLFWFWWALLLWSIMLIILLRLTIIHLLMLRVCEEIVVLNRWRFLRYLIWIDFISVFIILVDINILSPPIFLIWRLSFLSSSWWSLLLVRIWCSKSVIRCIKTILLLLVTGWIVIWVLSAILLARICSYFSTKFLLVLESSIVESIVFINLMLSEIIIFITWTKIVWN